MRSSRDCVHESSDPLLLVLLRADNGPSVNLLAEVLAESGDCEVHFAVACGFDQACSDELFRYLEMTLTGVAAGIKGMARASARVASQNTSKSSGSVATDV
jgi:hypothetical protein